MLSPKENVLAILKGEQPDYYFDFMDAGKFMFDPVFLGGLVPVDGEEHQDDWGTTLVNLPGSLGQHPHITDENKVIQDIENWKKEVKIPSLDGLDWTGALEAKKDIDPATHFSMIFCATGCFERAHFLMGMEDAFCNFLEYPEEMSDLIGAIADYKIEYIRRATEILKPDVIFYQDDWGSKQNLFLPPDVWREIIKPHQQRIADAIKDCGLLYVHHADCVCEPIVEDMVELGVDIWQGVIPENNIVSIQEVTNHKLAMQGGIDVPAIDKEGLSEEEIRAGVRKAFDLYCPGGKFFPGFPGGACTIKRNDEIARDEIAKYGRIWAQEHPVK